MSRFCPYTDHEVVYLTCQECENRICEQPIFYCMIVGSRTFTDYEKLAKTCDYLLSNQKNVVIVSGGARGADALAKRYALERGYLYKEFPADWDRYGKRAGYIRNEDMHKYIASKEYRGVIAFWDGQSKGTAQNFPLGQKYHNDIKIIRI